MFALIFMWTPPHFWALALFVKSDYGDAGVPMMTETHGRDATRRYVIIYAILLLPVAIGLGFTSIGGFVYLTISFLLNMWFLKGCFDIWRRNDAAADADNYVVERQVFKVSLYYLFGHFGALLAEAAVRASNFGG